MTHTWNGTRPGTSLKGAWDTRINTLLPEALEKWPLEWFEMLLPRQLEIIYEI